MKFVTFDSPAGERLGAMVAGGILDLVDAAGQVGDQCPATMQALIEAGPSAWAQARKLIERCPAESVRKNPPLVAPLPRPVRLRDASLFLEHLEIAFAKIGRSVSEQFKAQVIYYNADSTHVFGPEADVPWPRASDWIDYELEWACVIGTPGANIPVERARDHIFGFTIFNDWSARDLQAAFMEANLGPGGGKDFANSLGPCIATPDEFDDLYALAMTARVNGEQWSAGTTASMHWSFEEAIARLSVDRPLVAGEVIGSGTVLQGCGFEQDRRLAIGDRVELEVENIGILANRVVASV